MTPSRRLRDLIFVLALVICLFPLLLGVALLILLLDGRPVFYRSERMKNTTQAFILWKFRTMTPSRQNGGVSGGDKAERITPLGAFLRRSRLDELPQLWNILCADMSFVGPRPPLRRYVDLFPDLYAQVLEQRPGVTGLASLVFHRHEERLLENTASKEETESIYCRRCIARKARLDLIYAHRRTGCSDLRLMIATVFRPLGMHR